MDHITCLCSGVELMEQKTVGDDILWNWVLPTQDWWLLSNPVRRTTGRIYVLVVNWSSRRLLETRGFFQGKVECFSVIRHERSLYVSIFWCWSDRTEEVGDDSLWNWVFPTNDLGFFYTSWCVLMLKWSSIRQLKTLTYGIGFFRRKIEGFWLFLTE